jgi:uncharacterized protein (DUF2147 family)
MRKLAFSLFLMLSLTAAKGHDSLTPVGRWRTQMHSALVDIRNCANHSPCAFLAWVDQSVSQGNTTDIRNPNPALRTRPLIGVPIVWGLRRAGQRWEGGRVYNPETGQTFRSSMRYISDSKLRVTGCWGVLCRSEIWVKIDSPRH